MSQSEDTKVSTGTAVLVEVADALKASSSTVRSRLVATLTERELVKRVDLLDKALVKRKEVAKELDKIRAEDTFDGDGNKVPGTFTKAQYESRKKAKEKLSKFDAALERAFSGEGFDKLAQMVAGGGGGSDKDESESKED